MAFIYHMVPEDMREKTLYPLNILKEKFPDLYKKKNEKYLGRENVKKEKIPFLNCLWNDVLHFTAIHPSKFSRELKKAGLSPKKIEWYKVDTKFLEPNKTLIYLYKHRKNKKSFTDEENFTKFESRKVARFKEIPKRTSQYYKEMYKKGKRPFEVLLFHFVPHILYKGNLSVRGLKKIKS